jgi:hypothetical protein
MPSRLTDGLPITTEWLNSLVDAINDIQGNDRSSGGSGAISHMGITNNQADNLIIESGVHTGQALGSSNVYSATVEFRSAFADSDIVVVTTPAFVSTSTSSSGYLFPFNAYTSVGSITKTNFKLSAFMGNDDGTFSAGKTIIVNYIAIGRRP